MTDVEINYKMGKVLLYMDAERNFDYVQLFLFCNQFLLFFIWPLDKL